MSKFKRELRELINKHSKENASNTPDFVLATYLNDCIKAFNRATVLRESFYGRAINSNVKYDIIQKPNEQTVD